VHPFFYPPPFLLTTVWAKALSLAEGYRAYFWVNQVSLFAVLGLLWAWIRPPLWIFALLLLTFTPIPDDVRMGQANLVVLAIALFGLWRRSGAAVSLAAMCKMSPALYLAQWAGERRCRPVIVAMVCAVAWSLVSLPLAPLAVQREFYEVVLPGFSTGEYHGLTVPITLPANHSLADIFNQWWPGPNKHRLSDAARIANTIASLSLTLTVAWFARHRRDPLGSALFAGALTIVMLVTPIYTYEHHLVFLLLPLAALFTAWARDLVPRAAIPLGVVAYFCVAWPLSWIKAACKAFPALAGAFYETKFFGLLALAILSVWVGTRCPKSSS
jgi:hypothetical protein